MDRRFSKGFYNLKKYISSTHVLSSPLAREELLIYLATIEQVVSAVLVSGEGVQKPIFYIRKVLKDAETVYIDIEKLAFPFFW